jgi:DNA-binding protein Alba
MDKYEKVEKPREETEIKDNEIRITTKGKMRNSISYATTLFKDKGFNEVILKAMGRAINKTVTIAEIIKRRIPNLHQITEISSTDITDVYEPLEEGLDRIETTRHVSSITIILSTVPLDTSAPGYQAPLPEDQVKEHVPGSPTPSAPGAVQPPKGVRRPSARGAGRGPRGGRGGRRGGPQDDGGEVNYESAAPFDAEAEATTSPQQQGQFDQQPGFGGDRPFRGRGGRGGRARRGGGFNQGNAFPIQTGGYPQQHQPQQGFLGGGGGYLQQNQPQMVVGGFTAAGVPIVQGVHPLGGGGVPRRGGRGGGRRGGRGGFGGGFDQQQQGVVGGFPAGAGGAPGGPRGRGGRGGRRGGFAGDHQGGDHQAQGSHVPSSAQQHQSDQQQ